MGKDANSTSIVPVKEKKPRNITKKLGRPQVITMAVVERVSKDIADGLTVEQACCIEEPPINPHAFTRAVNRIKEFSVVYIRARALMIKESINIIKEGDCKELKQFPGRSWLLERTARSQFGREASINITNNHFAGVSVDTMGKARSNTRRMLDIQKRKAIDV